MIAHDLKKDITDVQFNHISALIQHHFGIHLTEQKRSLVAGRLQKLVRRGGYSSFDAFYRARLVQPSREILNELINALSTNHTYFYRESSHFTFLSEVVLPELIATQRQRRQLDLRVWCAASATGEEPYTLAMLLREALGDEVMHWHAGLLASDISEHALQHAVRGVYTRDNTAALPEPLRQRYLVPHDSTHLSVTPDLKRDVMYRRFNLMNPTYPFKAPFHVIFCRNVMIYFNAETRRAVVERLYQHTAVGGYLFIGHAEAIRSSRYTLVAPSVYKRIR